MVNTDTWEGNIHKWVNTRHGLEETNDRDEQSTGGHEVQTGGGGGGGGGGEMKRKNLKVMRAS